MNRVTQTESVSMHVSAVFEDMSSDKDKEKKDKVKDKNKEKDPATNPDAEMICYCCLQNGHHMRDCRSCEKDKDKKGVNAAQQALGLTPGVCSGVFEDTITGEHDRAGRSDSRSKPL